MKERTLTFGHEGILFKRSFVMYDKETETLWLHTTGQAIKGPLEGAQLTFLPSTVTTWKRWRERHPETTVLPGRKANRFMGSFRGKSRWRSFGLSVGSGDKAKLYPYEHLRAETVVNDTFDGRRLVLTFDEELKSATAYEAKLDGRELSFVSAGTDDEGRGLMKEKKSKSLWLRSTGRCVKGRYKERSLKQAVATPFLITRWRGFYPDGTIWESTRGDF